ncbi:MAG TPA: recombinase family protein [Tepidiformaceae bacterium]|nr:recombinase family protein [Tepidiformaceae bacterium]
MDRRGILVARVSSKKQTGPEHFSIEAQLRYMRECCERRGITIVEERVEPGTSAFTPDLRTLPVLYQTVLDIEAKRANCLVMHESSRLARNEQLGNHILDRLTGCGASFINSMIDIDYTTPEGRAFFNNEVSMNAYSSRKTSQHSKKGKLEQALQGLQVGQIPFGYAAQLRSDGTANRRLPAIIVPDEAEAIHRAFEDAAIGVSPNDIARGWNALGLRPRSVRGIERFQSMTVRGILANPYYRGVITHQGEERAGLHEPIVSNELWWSAQHPKKPIRRTKLTPLLLQGVASCFACGRSLYPLQPKKLCGPDRDARYMYYREPSKDFNADCVDSNKLWDARIPDRVVDRMVVELTTSPAWLEFVVAEAARLPADADARRRGLEESLRRVQKDYFRGNVADADYLALRSELEAELAMLPVLRPELIRAAQDLKTFGALWATGSAEARNETVRLLFERIVIDIGKKRVVEVKPHAEFEPLLRLRRDSYVRQTLPGRG